MDEKEKNLTQNEPAKPAEAPQEVEKAQAPQEGGANAEVVQELASEPTGAVSEEVVESPRGRATIMLDEELVMSEPTTAVTEAAPVVEKRAMAEVAAPKPPKKSHKGLIITIIATEVLAIGAVAAWWLMTNKNEGKVDEKVEEIAEEKIEVDCDATDGETTDCGVSAIEPVEINDPVVQKLWGYFNSDFYESTNVVGAMSGYFPLRSFYSEKGALSSDGLADVYKVAIALQKLGYPYDNAEACRGDYPLHVWTDLDNVKHSSVGMKACIGDDAVRELVKTIFGDTVDLAQFDDGFLEATTYDERIGKGAGIIVSGDGWEYSSKNDEMLNVASGATGAPTY